MSTEKSNAILKQKSIGSRRFAQIAKLGQVIFHTKDLANLWQIKNANTLYVTLGRYAKSGLIFRIHKGFYALKPIEKLDPYQLGVKALSGYGYISAETVLADNGIIFQSQPAITLISAHSKNFQSDRINTARENYPISFFIIAPGLSISAESKSRQWIGRLPIFFILILKRF